MMPTPRARLRAAGIAGSSFTMSPHRLTTQQYIVDTFIVVVFGGVESLIGTVASAFIIGQMESGRIQPVVHGAPASSCW
jgi:branched-subunit amino acid ABC-type transport system permease component